MIPFGELLFIILSDVRSKIQNLLSILSAFPLDAVSLQISFFDAYILK